MVLPLICKASSPKGTVNILARYNYFDSSEINSLIKNKCNVVVSYDSYYSTAESLRRISTTEELYHYDIAIFPSEIYEIIKKKIALKNSDLNKVIKNYHDDFKKNYLTSGYTNNVVYFVLSIAGFIWDPLKIDLSINDCIESMFEKAKDNRVVLIEGYNGVKNLIDNEQKLSGQALTNRFKEVIQDANVYITNGYNKIYSKDNFAFAFQRSGEAVFIIKHVKNKALSFIVHPKYSYVLPDVLAELNDRLETHCVARVLASKEALDIIQKETYYLSPYGTYKANKDPLFQSVYAQFLKNKHNIRWLKPISMVKHSELYDVWDKIHTLPQIMKNNTLVLKTKFNFKK